MAQCLETLQHQRAVYDDRSIIYQFIQGMDIIWAILMFFVFFFVKTRKRVHVLNRPRRVRTRGSIPAEFPLGAQSKPFWCCWDILKFVHDHVGPSME